MRLKQIWVTPEFKKFIYKKKSEAPDKKITDILDDLIKKEDGDKRKRNGIFPNF